MNLSVFTITFSSDDSFFSPFQHFSSEIIHLLHRHSTGSGSTGTSLAYHWHFTGTSLALHWHITGTSLAHHWHFTGTSLALHYHITGTSLSHHWHFTGTSLTHHWHSTSIELEVNEHSICSTSTPLVQVFHMLHW